jgi:hypothetical protein
VAVKVTFVPAQIILSASLDAIDTLTGKFGFTVTCMEFVLLTIDGAAHTAEEVTSKVTISLFASVEVV